MVNGSYKTITSFWGFLTRLVFTANNFAYLIINNFFRIEFNPKLFLTYEKKEF